MAVLASLLLCGECLSAPVPKWTLVSNGKPAAEIVVAKDAPAPIAIAAKDLQAYVKRMSGATLPIVAQPTASSRIRIRIAETGRATPETMVIATGFEGNGKVIRLSGGRVGAMYATYRFLELLGVRFFHPEQDYVPARKDISVGMLNISETPVYEYRGIQQHTLHAIPPTRFLLETTSDKDMQRALRYVDWLARNRQNYLFWWWVERVKPQDRVDYVQKIVKYAHDRGVKVGMVVGMPFDQQNSYNLLRGVACHSETEKWTAYLHQGVDEMAALGVDALCIFFGDNESGSFKQPAGCSPVYGVQATVDRIEAVRAYVKQKYPNMELTLWVHPTAGIRGNDECPNYFLLPKLCSPDVGAAVHSVQFYNLTDPAPTYANHNLNHLRDFALDQASKRPVWYWPESAYACGFDDDVPMFFPGYLTNRSKDAKLLAGKAVAHITFSTGIEWNYWLVDYAVVRYGWDPSRWTSDAVIEDFASIFGPNAGPVVAGALKDLAAANDEYLIKPATNDGYNLMLLLNAWTSPRQLDILPGRSTQEVVEWRARNLPPLAELLVRHRAACMALEETAPAIGQAQRPWFDELLDSVKITQLRVAHQLMVADAYSKRVLEPKADVKESMAIIAGLEDKAEQILNRRLQHFRYPTGGEEGNYTRMQRTITEWRAFAAKVGKYASPPDLYPGMKQWALALPYRITVVGEVGKRVKVRAKIDEEFPLDTPLKLYAQVEDLDSATEGVVQIGDQEFALPRTGDSHSRTVSIDIPAGLLKRGDNDIWFVFKDNVDGTTSGYYASAICVAAP